MADLRNIDPNEAANKFYDKNITRALDKFTSQEKHLRNLQEYKNEIKKLRSGPSQTFLNSNGSITSIRFNVDEKNEIKKMIYLKNHLNHRNFRTNERLMNIY